MDHILFKPNFQLCSHSNLKEEKYIKQMNNLFQLASRGDIFRPTHEKNIGVGGGAEGGKHPHLGSKEVGKPVGLV